MPTKYIPSEYGLGQHPNSKKALAENGFKPGFDPKRNLRGRPKIGATLRLWLHVLAEENDEGEPLYTLADIQTIADAPDDDKKIPVMKRAAAQVLVDICKGGKDAREALTLLLDRTEGRPSQNVNISADTTADPALELTEDTLAQIQAAALSDSGISDRLLPGGADDDP